MENKIALYERISQFYWEINSIEKQAQQIYGEDDETVDAIGFAAVYVMNAMHQVEETMQNPKIGKQTLRQALDVLLAIKLSSGRNRIEIENAYHHAVRNVAASYGITRNTVADIFIRRLGLIDKTEGFIDLVEQWIMEGDGSKLKKTLKAYTDERLHNEIDVFFSVKQQEWKIL